MSGPNDRLSRDAAIARVDELERDSANLRNDLAARDLRIEELEAEVASLRAAPAPAPAVVGELAWVLKVPLNHSGVTYPAGAAVPFDPKAPPEGCDGLVEGKHYERLRVLRS